MYSMDYKNGLIWFTVFTLLYFREVYISFHTKLITEQLNR